MDNQEYTYVEATDGLKLKIPKSDPNHDKLVKFANDVDTRKNLKKVGITDMQKQADYYLKWKHDDNSPAKPEISNTHRIALEANPSINGLGIGKRGEELDEKVKKWHRPIET